MSGIVDFTSKLATQVAAKGAKSEAQAALAEGVSTVKIAAQKKFLGLVEGVQKVAEPVKSGCVMLNDKVSNPVTEKLVEGASSISSHLGQLHSASSTHIAEEEEAQDWKKLEKIIGRRERIEGTKAAAAIQGTSQIAEHASTIATLSRSTIRGVGAVLKTVGTAASQAVEAVNTSYLLDQASNAVAPVANAAFESSKKAIEIAGTQMAEHLPDLSVVGESGAHVLGVVVERGAQIYRKLPRNETASRSNTEVLLAIDNTCKEVARVGNQVLEKVPGAAQAVRTEVKNQVEGAVDSLLGQLQTKADAPITQRLEDATKQLVTDPLVFATDHLLGDDAAEFREATLRISNRKIAPYKAKIQNGLNKVRTGIQKPFRSLALCLTNCSGRVVQNRYAPQT